MPCTPTATRASRTSSSLNGLMMAMTNFMNLSHGAPAADRGSISTFGYMPASAGRWSAAAGRTISALRPKIKRENRLFNGRSAPPWPDQDSDTVLNAAPEIGRGSSPRAPLPQQSLLRDRSHQRPVPRKDQAARKAARARKVGTVLGVQQPLVGAERPVKPERVIEARRHDGLVEHAAAVRDQRGIEQHHVGRVSEHALVDRRLVREAPGGADPNVEVAIVELLAEVAIEFDRPQLDRPLALVIAPHRIRHHRQHAFLELGF